MSRYSRIRLFQPIGEAGLRRLRQAAVLIVGAGALGGSLAEMLTRAGVGLLRIVDRDYVDWSNLQRQQLFTEQDALDVRPKAVAAAERLRAVNSDVRIEPVVADVTADNVRRLIHGVDLILDATDNFETRYLLNDAACEAGIPWIYGACVGASGSTMTVVPQKTPCLVCLFGEDLPERGETCDTVGVIAPAPQMTTAYQAAEALKLLTGNEDSLRLTFVSFDLWRNERAEIDVSGLRRPTCPSCGDAPTYPYLNRQKGSDAAVLCGRDTVQIRLRNVKEWSLETVAATARSFDPTARANDHLVAFRVNGHRLVVFKDGRVLVHNARDVATARRVTAQYLGM